MQLPKFAEVVSVEQRAKALRMLYEHQDDWEIARQNEALAHAQSSTLQKYRDKMQQMIFNVRANKTLKSHMNIAFLSDSDMARGTVIEDIERERNEQSIRFQNMLQEKYELASRSGTSKTTMRCRRCGGTDIFAEQKQTRGADEAMTVFCTCSRCSLRWTMR